MQCDVLIRGDTIIDPSQRIGGDPKGIVEMIRTHSDVAIGVKLRVETHIIGADEQGWSNLPAAIRAARESETWRMVHIGESPLSPSMASERSAVESRTCVERMVADRSRIASTQ